MKKKKEGKVRCSYPKCHKEATNTFKVSLTKKKKTSLELPFCEYHWFIVAGNHFKAEKIKYKDKSKNYTFELVGPTETVEITEQVMGAIKYMENKKK